jgi:hypothetical protein
MPSLCGNQLQIPRGGNFMKNRTLNVFTAAGFLLASALFFASSATPRPAGQPPAAPQERREAFEDLRRAEGLLRDARAILAAAPGEYGGHRDKAIHKIDEALGQIREAREYH